MTKRIKKVLSFYEEENDQLKEVSESLAMKESEVVRHLVKKIAEDKTLQQIILKRFLDDEGRTLGKDRILRIMSVRSTLKKDPAADAQGSRAVSSNCLLDFSKWGGLEQAERIARLKWMEDIQE